MIAIRVLFLVAAALASAVTIAVGPLGCSALVTTNNSSDPTISSYGRLTSVRARRVSTPSEQPVAIGQQEFKEDDDYEDADAPIKSNSRVETPTSFKGRLARQASDFGNYFKTKLQANFASAQGSCSMKAGELKHRMETSYLTIIIRFSKWYSAYKTLYQSNRETMIEPMALVKQEFGKVSADVHQKELMKVRELSVVNRKPLDDDDLKAIESMDYLVRVLQQVLEKLENDLELLKDQMGATVSNMPIQSGEKNDEIDDDDDDELSGFEDEQDQKARMDEAINRAIGIVRRATTRFVIGELAMISQLALLDSLATYVMTQPDNALGSLFPIIKFIGTANTPLVTSYLRNLQIRTTLNFIGLCNPIPGAIGRMLKVKESK